jgi:hypothetical protein
MFFSVVALTIALGLQFAMNPKLNYRDVNVLANWAYSPKSLEEADSLASQVVVGRVVNVRKGKDIVVPQHNEPSGEMRIPTEVVTIHVDNTLKGVKQSVIKLFHTGTSRYTAVPREIPKEFQGKGQPANAIAAQLKPFLLEGDPEYVVGERYLLFLTDGPDLEKGLQRVVAPEGRYAINEADGLVPVEHRGLSKKLKGVALSEFHVMYNEMLAVKRDAEKISPAQ